MYTIKEIAGPRTLLLVLALAAAGCSAGTSQSAADTANTANTADVVEQEPTTSSESHSFGTSFDQWTEDQTQQPASTSQSRNQPDRIDNYKQLTWKDLVPSGAFADEILERYRERIAAAEAGSDEVRELYKQMQEEYDDAAVNRELDGVDIYLAGFVAPLTFEDDLVTEFLLVPTFGACIHVPPPPPNQTILVTVPAEQAFTIDETYGAVWVAGKLAVESSETDLASSSYTIVASDTDVYAPLP